MFFSVIKNFKCKRFCRKVVSDAIEAKVTLEGDEIEVMKKFCYYKTSLANKLEFQKLSLHKRLLEKKEILH